MKIQLKKILKTYPDGRQALKGINLELKPGLFGLLGPNGAGKTTLLSLLSFLLEPSGGSIEIEGYSLPDDLPKFRRRLGFLPQYFDFPQRATGREILEYFARLYQLPGEVRCRRIDFLLNQVGLTGDQHRKSRDYSVGMKKRLGVAQALLGDPELLLLDEPTTGLDPEERILFCNYLTEISGKRIIVLSTHIVKDVEESAQRMAVLNEGNWVYEGAPWKFVHRAKGKVWTLRLPREQAEKWQEEALPPGAQVAGRRDEDGWVELRVLSEQTPGQGAQEATPNLEDAYLLQFQQTLEMQGVEDKKL